MSFLFWAVAAILFLLFPIFIQAKGAFSLDKKTLFVKLSLFGIKMLSVTLYFSPQGIEWSLNGKKGKILFLKERSGTPMPIGLEVVRITYLRIDVYSGNDVAGTTCGMGVLFAILDPALGYLRSRKLLDRAAVRILPCYVNEQTTVKFSIRLFTGIALFLGGIIHTKRGYAKRSHRKDHG